MNPKTNKLVKAKKSDIIVSSKYQIYETDRPWDLFNLLDTNREIDKNNVRKIKEEIKKSTFLPTVLVYEDSNGILWLFDGQHTTTAGDELGEMIHYIILHDEIFKTKPEDQLSAVSKLVQSYNNTGKGWGFDDWVDSYIKDGKTDYIIVKDWMQNYRDGLGLTWSMLENFIAFNGKEAGRSGGNGGYVHKICDLKNGVLSLTDTIINNVDDTLEYLSFYAPYIKDIKGAGGRKEDWYQLLLKMRYPVSGQVDYNRLNIIFSEDRIRHNIVGYDAMTAEMTEKYNKRLKKAAEMHYDNSGNVWFE